MSDPRVRVTSSRHATVLTGLAVAAITLAAAAIRLHDLGSQPGGLYPDEAAEGLSALRLLHEPGYHPVFFADDGGREALFAYIVAAAFRVFGAGIVVLRGVSAVLGAIAVLATFVAVRRFGRGAALGATLWAAGSLWLISVSRDGMRNIICVVVGTFALAALMRWHDEPRRRSAVLAGIFLGLGLWTYQPLKLLPFIAIGWLFLLRRHDREQYDAMTRHARPLLVSFFVVAAPMIITAVLSPAAYFGRGAEVTAFNPLQSQSSIFGHTIDTLGQFFIWGDPNGRHDVNGLPLLGVPLSVLAGLGLWRCWRQRADGVHLLVLIALPAMLIPPIIAIEGGAPHFLRNLGMAPYIAVLIGLGCADAVERAAMLAGRRARIAAIVGLTGLLAALGTASTATYFARGWAARYDPYTADLVAMSEAANQGPGALAVSDDYAAFDINFLDYGNPPTIVAPHSPVGDPRVYSLVVARTPADMGTGLGSSTVTARAHPIAFDANGAVRVYVAAP